MNARNERLYLVASAKAQIVAAEQLLREAVGNLEDKDASAACRKVINDVVDLRDRVFQLLENLP